MPQSQRFPNRDNADSKIQLQNFRSDFHLRFLLSKLMKIVSQGVLQSTEVALLLLSQQPWV